MPFLIGGKLKIMPILVGALQHKLWIIKLRNERSFTI